MKTNINLIPAELGQAGPVVRISNLLNSAALFMTVIFIALGVVGGAYLLILGGQISASNQAKESTVSEIERLKEVEAQYVLVKDRVDKIKPIIAEPGAEKYMGLFKSIVSSLPDSTAISEAEVDGTLMKLTFQASKSSDLVNLFSSLSQGGVFKRVYLKNFSFNKSIGYVASLEVTP